MLQNRGACTPSGLHQTVLADNCVCLPVADRLFTTGEVGVAASAHIPDTNYSAVVQKALEMPGFSHEPEPKFVTVGFGHQTTLGAAGGGPGSVLLLRRFW